MEKQIQPVILTIIKKDTRILMTKRAEFDPEDAPFHGFWQIPGGGMEFAESPEETATREAREELGIDIEIVSLVPAIYTRVFGNWQGLLIGYLCRMKYPEQPIVINEEASDFTWVTIEEAKKLQVTPFTELLIEQASLIV